MGCVYRRKNKLWVKFRTEKGTWKYKPSGFDVGDERKAKGVLERIENLVAAGVETKSDGPLTVKGWSDTWLESCRQKGVATIRHYEARLRDYILPVIGHMRLDAVRVSHMLDVIAHTRKQDVAPRTIRHVYFLAHTMFKKAVQRDLILGNPCTVDKDDLPGKIDKDPEWRATAIHTRDELERMISDERIPEWRRMFWGMLFLSGVRFGEGSARHWRHYDPDAQPLGKLVVNTSYDSQAEIEKPTKTKHQREVPVHPVLAAMLAEWKLGGWERAMGRPPTDDDLIVPFAEPGDHFGEHLDDQTMLRRFHWDLETLGLRPRRQHDTRRTFISLCLSDGARKDILKWVTHSRPHQDQMDDYTTLLWTPLCEEVAKLKVRLRREPGQIAAVVNAPAGPSEPEVSEAPASAPAGAAFAAESPSGVTPRVTPENAATEISFDPALLTPILDSARRGTRTPMAVNR